MAVDVEYITAVLRQPDQPSLEVRPLVQSLLARYEEPWRYYHTGEHVLELFDLLDQHQEELRSPRNIGWAILYHDAIYDPASGHGRNEELSARLAEHELSKLGCASAGLVAAYTRATASHQCDGWGGDLDFFLDADLAILGSSPERYGRYAQDIRLEYAEMIEPGEYLRGRIPILQSLAKRSEKSGLYKTELFKHRFEDQAQANIATEISELKLGLS